MATLTSKLIISLVDQASGPARAIVGHLRALQNAARTAPMAAMATEAKKFGAAVQRFSATVSGPLALGMTALVQSTQAFEKALVGVQVAGIADNLKDGVVNFQQLRKEAEQTKKVAMQLSEALKLNPDELLKGGEAAAKMGLPSSSLGTLMKMGASIKIQDQSLTTDQAVEFLGSMGINFKAGEKGFERGVGAGDYGADITKLANQLLAVANMTRTSAGKLQEGMRQFAPLYASFGATFAESASMIGAMTQAGQLDTESGTALKSLGVRLLRPTSQSRDAMISAGIDRAQFMDLSAVSANQAFNSLVKLTDVKMNKASRAAIRKKLIDGEQGKLFTNDAWQQEFLRIYNDATGAKTAEARDANMERMMMSILTGGGKIDMFGFTRMLAEKMEKGELTDSQMAAIGEGRHLSKYKALFALMPKMLELLDKTQGLKSEYTDAGNKLWTDSSAGKWEGSLAALNRAFIRLRESEGINRLIDSLARLGDAIAQANPSTIEAIGVALAGLAIAGPIGLALSGLASGLAVLASAAQLAAIPILAATGGAGAAAAGGVGAAAGAAAAVGGTAVGAAMRGAFVSIGNVVLPVAAGVAVGEALNATDKSGTLWGLLDKPNDWIKGTFGMDFSKSPFSEEFWAKPQEQQPAALPSIPPRPSSSGLPVMDGPFGLGQDLSQAGAQTGQSFTSALESELQRARSMVSQFASEMRSMLNFSASPTITPRINAPAAAPASPDSSSRSARARIRGLKSDYSMMG